MKTRLALTGRRLLISVWLLAAAACAPGVIETVLPLATLPPVTPPPPTAMPAHTPAPTMTPMPALSPVPPSATPRRFPALRFTVPLGSRSQGMVGELLVTEETFLQLRVYDERVGLLDGAGIERVTFEVFGPDNFYYFREERTAPYCVFNGSGRCDPWRLEGDRLLWPDGAPVTAGAYSVQVIAVAVTPDADGDRDGNWNFDVTIELP